MNIETIMKRKSVRNYDGKAITAQEKAELLAFIERLNGEAGVFGGKVRLKYIETETNGEKLGTYGVIKGAGSYLAAACGKGAYDLEDAGYQFEKLILFATWLGLGTVILGGTFRRGGFVRAMALQEGETLPVISPVGHEGGKKSFIASMMKSHVGVRKPFGELFTGCDGFTELLEAVRQAPSAMNSQPWRVAKDGGGFHFYNAGTLPMNRIDLGIALCHFEIAAKEKGLAGGFADLKKENEGERKYLLSWVTP